MFGAGFCPPEADAPLTLYTDAVLSGSISFERFQAITGRYSQILEICGDFKLSQFPAANYGDFRESLDAVSFRKVLGIGALEGSDHLRI
jgi:hypothetical protein